MKRYNLIFALISMGMAACNNGGSTASGTNSTTSTCQFGQKQLTITAESYNPGDKFSTVFDSCEFERDFEDQFFSAYADHPTAPGYKTASIYQFYSYANLETIFEKMFPTRSSPNRPFNSGDYFTDMRELSAFLANIAQETNSGASPSFDSSGRLTVAGALGVAYGLSTASEGDCVATGNCLSLWYYLRVQSSQLATE